MVYVCAIYFKNTQSSSEIEKYFSRPFFFCSTGDDAVLSVGGALSTVCSGACQGRDTADIIHSPPPQTLPPHANNAAVVHATLTVKKKKKWVLVTDQKLLSEVFYCRGIPHQWGGKNNNAQSYVRLLWAPLALLPMINGGTSNTSSMCLSPGGVTKKDLCED